MLGRECDCTKNPIYVFPENELRGLSPNSDIYVSVSDRVHIFDCSKIDRPIQEYTSKSLTDI
jgi:hypothetical protein